ncbi:MAG: phenylalanine--tRNA ligase subunit beta [Candidatus Aenigmarchaeota archaeon]|nr:phenylalanine--tRNA ligase subunit beta [Candidatus Aenigmarchaeota archaeon]
MPTIEVSRKILEKLAGRKITEDMLDRVKGEIEEENEGAIKLEIGDTNRPDLWSVEGVARVYRERGMPKLKLKKSDKKIIVDKTVETIRPYIAGFIARKAEITEELLLDLIQLQEKIAENFGRKREKISIGIYNYADAKFPLRYKAIEPSGIKFAPLEFEEEMNLDEILEKHPKGWQYGHIVRKHKLYPIFTDSRNQVLSFPPVINSNHLGRVREGTSDIFIEATGSDIKPTILAVNVIALALQDRGASIESIEIQYPYATPLGRKVTTPLVFDDKMSIPQSLAEERLGLSLNAEDMISLLKSMQYDAVRRGKNILVTIPYYRRDVMHPFDIMEDIAIAYGYGNIRPAEVKSFTPGGFSAYTSLSERARRSMIGMGFQEIMSPILSNKAALEDKMRSTEKIIEIENFMSETYSAVRNGVLPSLLNMLGKNLHVEYPHRIFEFGECAVLDTDPKSAAKLAAAIADTSIGYEDISSVVDALLGMLGVKYELKPSKSKSFIEGRQAHIIVDKKAAGIVGEVDPQVLQNWGIDTPVVAFEIDANSLAQ